MLTRSLNSPDALPHIESLHALDWLNFFIAALLMGLGPFVAVKLADRGWMPASIGLVLTASGLAGLLTQVPAGEALAVAGKGAIDHLVASLRYAGGPLGRDKAHGDLDSSFLFPQMIMRDEPEEIWSPQFIDYLFLAFNTSTAFSPTDTAVLSRWAKVVMMVQSIISLMIVTLLAARAVGIL